MAPSIFFLFKSGVIVERTIKIHSLRMAAQLKALPNVIYAQVLFISYGVRKTCFIEYHVDKNEVVILDRDTANIPVHPSILKLKDWESIELITPYSKQQAETWLSKLAWLDVCSTFMTQRDNKDAFYATLIPYDTLQINLYFFN